MNDQPLLPKSLLNLCRTCMSAETNLTSLFSVLSLSNNEEALNSILYKCTAIQVCNTDVLPQSICDSCLEKLAICYLYRELCFETQSKLQQLYNSEKQPFSYINNSAEDNSYLGIAHTSHTDHINGRTKSEYTSENVNENTNVLLPDTKPIEQDFERHENLEQSCDNEYLDCDNQNSFGESDEGNSLPNDRLDFSCVICPKKCNSKYALNRHLKTHSDLEKLKCHVCNKKFTRATDVKRHLTTHTGEKPYPCDICECSFTQSGSLAIHKRQKHKDRVHDKCISESSSSSLQEKSHLCSICGTCFRHKSTLTMHMRRHVGDKPYECQMCKTRFVSSARLRSHLRVHSGERPFVCHICNRRFAHSTVLSRHLKAHADIKPHKCSYCAKRFLSPYYLNIHTRKHTGEKPLNCSTCGKTFACPNTLKQHQKIHTNEKPYLCMNCGKSFRRSHHLKYHMKQHGKV